LRQGNTPTYRLTLTTQRHFDNLILTIVSRYQWFWDTPSDWSRFNP